MDCSDIVVGMGRENGLGRVVDSFTRDRSTPLPDQGPDQLVGDGACLDA